MISVLIPARNEKHLQRTIDDVFEHARTDLEVLVALDNWDNPPPIRASRVIDTRLGQRGATNALLDIAQHKIIMKLDAHCTLGPGFDHKMLKDFQSNWILSPYMLVLDEETWQPKPEKRSSQYVFGEDFVMQYGEEKKDVLSETMCLQGSCWMTTKDNYIKWELGDTSLGSWGGQGVELGIKAYLNGGVCMTTKETYYAHLFRTTDADFPYDRGENPGQLANTELIKRYSHLVGGLAQKFGRPWAVDNRS